MPYSAPAIFMGPGALAADSGSGRDRTSTHALTSGRAEVRRALLVGTTDPYVSSLLTDVLRDVHLDVRLDTDDAAGPDVVLAMVDRIDGVRAITDARARFPKAPVVAILTLGTHRLGTRAVAAGAAACYVLDMPIDRLRGLLTALLAAPATVAPTEPKSKPARR